MKFRTTAGGRVERSKKVRFTFDGKPFEGLAGDTLASALLAKLIVHHNRQKTS